MRFLEFKERLFPLACFNINQVLAWQPGFDRNNITRWIKKGYIIRLRQGLYAFAEYKNKTGYSLYFANRIYHPSYISLHAALAFYGLIPESVVQITSVTSQKTLSFANGFGEYSYKTVKENLMFGYDLKPMADNRSLKMATPEKALFDMLYLYPFYDNIAELEELRLDESYLQNEFNWERLAEYASIAGSKALDHRFKLLKRVYGS
jgi:predicted transcriptional regulator of viral defense system